MLTVHARTVTPKSCLISLGEESPALGQKVRSMRALLETRSALNASPVIRPGTNQLDLPGARGVMVRLRKVVWMHLPNIITREIAVLP